MKRVGLTMGRRMAGRDWQADVVSARSTVLQWGQVIVTTGGAALGATTAIAAGFLFAVGIDVMALLGKWTIVSAILFYTGILWALVSPLVALSQVGQEIVFQREKNVATAHGEAEQKKREEIQRLKAELQAAEAEAIATKSNWPLWWRAPSAAHSQAIDTVTALRERLAGLNGSVIADARPSEQWLGNMMKGLVAASYLIAATVLLVFALGPRAGGAIAVGLAGLAALGLWARSINVVYPLISVLMLAFGFLLGKAILSLPPTAHVQIEAGAFCPGAKPCARVLLTTASDILLVQDSGTATPTLTLLRRSDVKRVSIVPGRTLDGWPGAYLFQRWLF